MKNISAMRLSTAVIIAITMAAARWSLAVLPPPIVTVDEFGNGTYGSTPLTSQVAGGSLGLQYNLPYVVGPGCVVIHDLSLSGPISDVINFTNTFLFFASSSANGSDSPADVANFFFTAGPRVDVVEDASGAQIFASYMADSGMPGFNGTSQVPAAYTFISEVPEPGVCGLALLGAAMLLPRRCRR